MIQNATIMGMPVSIHIIDEAQQKDIHEILDYMRHIDDVFSTYKSDSEISKINTGSWQKENFSNEVKLVLELCEQTKRETHGYFSITIAGDAEVVGKSEKGNMWEIGIQNPFNSKEIIKVIALTDKGIATSGNYIQGQHIYNPITKTMANEIASMTVIGPNAYEADRFATAAFAMGENGIVFIERLRGFEGYMVTKNKKAIYTSGFEALTL